MDLGVRQIRSSGNGSGSVEVTLPSALRDLVGLPCRITLRDGLRPDIVLQPDFRPARAAFTLLWRHLATSLPDPFDDAATTDLPVTRFALRLAPGSDPCEGADPVLAWLDGLALSGPPPHDAQILARCVAGLAHARAAALGLRDKAGFGAGCAYALTGIVVHPAREEICGILDFALTDHSLAIRQSFAHAGEDAQSPAFWHASGAILRAVTALFHGWNIQPDQHDMLRAAWRRSITIEMNGG
jgi:hypothetical protein